MSAWGHQRLSSVLGTLVRFAPQSGPGVPICVSPLCANTGHSRSLGERGNGGFRDFLAPLLDEVTAVWNFERRGTPAYLLTQCRHHRRSPYPGFHPHRPATLPPPLIHPPLSGAP